MTIKPWYAICTARSCCTHCNYSSEGFSVAAME